MLIPSLMFALVPHKLRNDAEPFYGAYRPLTDVAFYMLNHSYVSRRPARESPGAYKGK